jgi:hypothetical protein
MAMTVSLPRQLGWAPDDSAEWDESPVVCALRLQIKAASASQVSAYKGAMPKTPRKIEPLLPKPLPPKPPYINP